MCGIFGMIDYGVRMSPEQRKKMVFALGKASEARGTDAGGIAFTRNGRVIASKGPGGVSTNGSLDLKGLYETNKVFLGHTRMTTHGSALDNANNHPFVNDTEEFAMAHNGVLSNHTELGFTNKLPKTPILTDSYVAVQLMDQLLPDVSFVESLKLVAEDLRGTFNLTFLDKEDTMWIVKNNNPLIILDIRELNVIIYTSTEAILVDALIEFYGLRTKDAFVEELMKGSVVLNAKFNTPVAGDIIKIKRDGTMSFTSFTVPAYVNDYLSTWEYYQNKDKGYDSFSYATYGKKNGATGTKRESTGGVHKLSKVLGYRGVQNLIHNGNEIELVGSCFGHNKTRLYSRYLGRQMSIDEVTFLLDEKDFEFSRCVVNFNELIDDFELPPHLRLPSTLYVDQLNDIDIKGAFAKSGISETNFKYFNSSICDVFLHDVPDTSYSELVHAEYTTNYFMMVLLFSAYIRNETMPDESVAETFASIFMEVLPAHVGWDTKITPKDLTDLQTELLKKHALLQCVFFSMDNSYLV